MLQDFHFGASKNQLKLVVDQLMFQLSQNLEANFRGYNYEEKMKKPDS